MNGEGCVTKVHIDARRYWKFPSKGCVIKVEKVPLNKTFEKEFLLGSSTEACKSNSLVRPGLNDLDTDLIWQEGPC